MANQIEVVTAGNEADARRMNSDLDKGIEHNLDAALVRAIRESSRFPLTRSTRMCFSTSRPWQEGQETSSLHERT